MWEFTVDLSPFVAVSSRSTKYPSFCFKSQFAAVKQGCTKQMLYTTIPYAYASHHFVFSSSAVVSAHLASVFLSQQASNKPSGALMPIEEVANAPNTPSPKETGGEASRGREVMLKDCHHRKMNYN